MTNSSDPKDRPKFITVTFKMRAVDGWTEHQIRCPAAPTLTASGLAIKAAGGVELSRRLYFDEDVDGGSREVGDIEAVVLQRDGSTRFISVPQGRY